MRANATDRTYLWVTALLFAAGLYACWAMLPLAWDGGYQFTDTLINGRPYTYYGRVHTWPMWWPMIWATHFTSNPRILQAIYGAPFLLAPALSMLLCWWIARKNAPGMLLWAAFGISIGALPGQVFVINDTVLMYHLVWPLLFGALLPITRAQFCVLLLIAPAQFIQPTGFFHLAGVIVAALLLAMEAPAVRKRQLLAAGVAALLLALAIGKLFLLPDPQVRTEASPLELLKRWHNGVEGMPLGGMLFFWGAAALAAAALWWKRSVGLVPQPGIHRTGDRLRRVAWTLSALLAVGGAVVWTIWASHAVHWRLAVDYRRYVLPLALPFLIGATVAAVYARYSTAASVMEARAARRSALPLLLGATFLVVLSVQSVVWLNLLRRLKTDVEAYPDAIVPRSALPWVKGTAMDHWSTPTNYLAMCDKEPKKLIIWEPAWLNQLTADWPKIPTTDWASYEPEAGRLGYYNFRPLLPRLRSEALRLRASEYVPSSDGGPAVLP